MIARLDLVAVGGTSAYQPFASRAQFPGRCDRLLVAGTSTEGCVAQTAIDARELGYKVTVLAGACATTDEALEQTALRYLVDVVGVRLAEPEEILPVPAPV